ncbi:MAG: hypothetical protein P4L27_01525, partial [Ignavibacteriaceae bacterium]|nr:hypothetical protein [Ignavibacteriaceae bacterium]
PLTAFILLSMCLSTPLAPLPFGKSYHPDYKNKIPLYYIPADIPFLPHQISTILGQKSGTKLPFQN